MIWSVFFFKGFSSSERADECKYLLCEFYYLKSFVHWNFCSCQDFPKSRIESCKIIKSFVCVVKRMNKEKEGGLILAVSNALHSLSQITSSSKQYLFFYYLFLPFLNLLLPFWDNYEKYACCACRMVLRIL